MVKIKEAVKGKKAWPAVDNYPEVTLLVAAYNEKDNVDAKVKNSLELEYPKDKLKLVWVSDGSDDGTTEMLQKYPEITVFHQPERYGKVSAINRAVPLLTTPIIVFSDANTELVGDAVSRMVRFFTDPNVGCVSGVIRIFVNQKDMAAGSGEGLYWKYESFQKRYDARLYSVVGTAGELFAIRRELYTEMESDTLLDDFMISLRIAMKGYVTQYDPDAYAYETSSLNVKEELKRKIRISAGGFQSMVRLAPLLNIFKYGVLSFQYISHRVLRWTLAPLCLLLLLISNSVLACQAGLFSCNFFSVIFWMQVLFYVMVLWGWLLENKQIKFKILFVPYYFFIMNLSVYLGWLRYMKKNQDVKWERAKRR